MDLRVDIKRNALFGVSCTLLFLCVYESSEECFFAFRKLNFRKAGIFIITYIKCNGGGVVEHGEIGFYGCTEPAGIR